MLKEFEADVPADRRRRDELVSELEKFAEFGSATVVTETRSSDGTLTVPTFVNEFWTSGQRDAHRLHEVSYRACFKPQLPRFFIERLTRRGDVVYDPFMGRGTTLLEAALLGRTPYGNDINPLSEILIKPRLAPPAIEDVAARLQEIPFDREAETLEDLLVFYHPDTLRQICALRAYLIERRADGTMDSVDEWIRMVAINRLTGHSVGFFSVYTLPPNQAVSIKAQEKINRDRNQKPESKDVAAIILKKTRSLLGDGVEGGVPSKNLLLNALASQTSAISAERVSLVVTSPPFLDVVDYAGDNWLRCWFAGIDAKAVKLTVPKRLEDWKSEMTKVFVELHRVLVPGGRVAFEVGEVRAGKIKLEETVIAAGSEAQLVPEVVVINQQEFTKTANCWGVNNNCKGTNSNRIVVLQKPGF